jgi:hypothetical protein
VVDEDEEFEVAVAVGVDNEVAVAPTTPPVDELKPYPVSVNNLVAA